jgi:hypothetical protein
LERKILEPKRRKVETSQRDEALNSPTTELYPLQDQVALFNNSLPRVRARLPADEQTLLSGMFSLATGKDPDPLTLTPLSESVFDSAPYTYLTHAQDPSPSSSHIKLLKALSSTLQLLRHPSQDKHIYITLPNTNLQGTESERHIISSAQAFAVHLGPYVEHKPILAFSVLCSIVSFSSPFTVQAHFYSNNISSAHITELPCRDEPPSLDYHVLWDTVSELLDLPWFRRPALLTEVCTCELWLLDQLTAHRSKPFLIPIE